MTASALDTFGDQSYLFIFKCLFILRERESTSRGGAEGERGESIPGRLHAVSTEPDVGLELTKP